MTGNSDEPASSTTPTSTAQPVTLTSQQLQEIVKGAVAGALAQMSAKSDDGTQGPTQLHNTVKQPDQPTVDLNCNESRWEFFLNEWQL